MLLTAVTSSPQLATVLFKTAYCLLNSCMAELGVLPPCSLGTGVPLGSWGFQLRSPCLYSRHFPASAPLNPVIMGTWEHWPLVLGSWGWFWWSPLLHKLLSGRCELAGTWPVGCVQGWVLKSVSTGADKGCVV